MSVVNNNLLLAAEDGGYVIDRSLRFRSSASAYLNRTPASAGNRRTWTWSGWVKRGTLSGGQRMFEAGTNTSNFTTITWQSDNQTVEVSSRTSTNQIRIQTTATYRDPSAWYHIVVAVDTTNATSDNRTIVYVNGVRQTALLNNQQAPLNYETFVNATNAHFLASDVASGQYLDGYMTEINFVDGQALTPSSFGETNALTGVWQPKAYEGTYGTNGFYLNFSDPSAATAAAIGKDYSGNGNNWTPNNVSVTAGVTYDSMIDTPTPYADGGNVRGNFAVLNPLDNNSLITLSNGNLQATTSATSWPSVFGSIAVSEGKYYFEITPTQLTTTCAVGVYVGGNRVFPSSYPYDANTYMIHQNGDIYHNNNVYAYQSSYTVGDVLGVVVDATARKVWISKNGVFPAGNDPAAGTGGLQAVSGVGAMPAGPIFPVVSLRQAAAAANFGQRPFAYTPPSGFKALHTGNLPEPAIVDGGEYFNTVLFNGTGSNGNAVTGVGFQPDFVWVKSRSNAFGHNLSDVLRGPDKILSSHDTDSEKTYTNICVLNADGFTLSSQSSANVSGTTNVGWNWKANGAGVTNTAGSITSTVSANPTAGFSIVTYTGTGANATVGHGLGVAPAMMIVKSRNNADNWYAYHASIGNTGALNLNLTNATITNSGYWNNTSPTSSVFTIGTIPSQNTWTYIAYCFAEVPGYSRFGSYTGNGSADGPFVFCGFRPRYVLIKRTDASDKWTIRDTARSTTNTTKLTLNANDSQAEYTPASEDYDILSNGFKMRNSDGAFNASGGTYIFAAFSESPFKYSLAR